MNPFDEILDGMRLRHALYACFQLRAPWSVSFDTGEYARLLIVSKGACYLQGEQRAEPVLLEADTCLLIQPGVQFSLYDGGGSLLISCDTLARYPHGEPITHGGDGALTEIVTARFAFNKLAAEPLFNALGPLVHTRLKAEDAYAIKNILHVLQTEAQHRDYGTQLINARLIDVLFIQVLRALSRCAFLGAGLLAGIRDPRMASVLQAVHQQIAYPWTVEEMGALIGLSRSTFSALFKAALGQAPLAYLTAWRIYKAKLLLASGSQTIGDIAAQVGYDNESSLSRAFSRLEGVSPGVWRQRQRAET
ncbi:AraC family transcriptional regulator [Alcaligenes faecalis]|uniref:AraC family transcriptional regulator n=1 Tax=Alcaligenes faecalis TaxID=511 RepID=UPI0012938B62|nr:AraC family transcriptional regulator [Alcaligenes faecalis]QFY77943.1 AraC family transcriptional regulator [Alcaligenes faecalis]